MNTSGDGSNLASKLPGHDALYRRIEADIRERIAGGQWGPGAALPTRRALAKQYGVTTNTMNRALQRLIDEGTLSAATRHGTFVAEAGSAPDQARPSSPLPSRPARTGASSVSVGIVNMRMPGEDLTNWGPTVQRAAEDCLSECGAVTRSFDLDGSANCMRRTLDDALASGMDAILVVYLNDVLEWEEEAWDAHVRSGRPLMLAGTRPLDTPVPHTYVDEHASGAIVVDHMLQEGYRKLSFLAPFDPPNWLTPRIDGARRAARAGRYTRGSLEVHPAEPTLTWSEWIAAKDGPKIRRHVEGAVAAALEGEGPLGIIAPNDHTARQIVPVLESQSLALGHDVGLCSFDDIPEAAILGITSMRHPLVEMVKTASRLLVEAVNGSSLPTRVCESARLIRRGSSSRNQTDAVGPKGTSNRE